MADLTELLNNEIVYFVAVLVISLIIAKIVYFILDKYVKRLTRKTKSEIDDLIVEAIHLPLYIGIMLVGLYFALKRLTILIPYEQLIGQAFYVIFVLVVAFVFQKILGAVFSGWFTKRKGVDKTPKVLMRIVYLAVYLVAVIVILSYFKVEITPLIATLGIGGIAIGLALQDTLSNFFAGLNILSDQPIKVGDYIEIDAGTKEGVVRGYVEDITWRTTRIRTTEMQNLANNYIIVPNSKLAQSIITNYDAPKKEVSIIVNCGVDYKSDLEKVEKITLEVAKKIQKTVPGAVRDFEPFIRFHTFGESNINFYVTLRSETFIDKYLITHEFMKALKKRYDKDDIEISWPVRKIYQGKNK
jgi:small-conductance mechanosensitive channel